MNSQKILLITGEQSKLSYHRHYNNFFNRKKDFMCYRFSSGCKPKQFCEQNDFSPDVILFDYCFTNFVILGNSFSEIKSDYLAGFDDCIKILHSHKDMHPETIERVKRFCDILDIKNLFHINCIFFDEFSGDKRNQKINFEVFYSGLNYHPIEYGFDESTFEDIDYAIEKTNYLTFAGVMGNHPSDSPLGKRRDFLQSTIEICERNNFPRHFLTDGHYENIKEYSHSMLRSKITIDTPTVGGHISARLFEIPLHKSAIMVFENEIYDSILEDGVNSIIIKKDFSDLEEKLKFYLTDDEGKIKLKELTENAFTEFNQKHTIESRLEYMLKLSGESHA